MRLKCVQNDGFVPGHMNVLGADEALSQVRYVVLLILFANLSSSFVYSFQRRHGCPRSSKITLSFRWV
jgi:hypothetical protein